MTDFSCPRCKGNDFVRLERISVDSTGTATGAADAGYRCINCQQRIDVDESGTITAINTPGPGQPLASAQRVRSSVTADQRGVPAISARKDHP